MRYQDKVVIVTGGTKGIGLGCVRAFVGAGARVVVDGQVTRIDDMSLDELFGVVDEVETRILGETPG